MINLRPFEPSLGNGYLIEMDNIYFYNSIHDEWQSYSDNSGEYKDVIYYSYNAHKVLELIDKNFATLKSIDQKDFDVRYFFIMRRKY